MTKLYLARHGETIWNKEERVQGKIDIELSDLGIKQAELLGKRIVQQGIDVIYSSSLKRARATADVIGSLCSKAINESVEIQEISLGPWEGMTMADIKTKYEDAFRIYIEDPANFSLPGAETLVELINRTRREIIRIINAHKNEKVLLVSHGVTIKAAIITMLGLDISHYRKFKTSNASLTILDFQDGNLEKAVLELHNDVSHLQDLR